MKWAIISEIGFTVGKLSIFSEIRYMTAAGWYMMTGSTDKTQNNKGK